LFLSITVTEEMRMRGADEKQLVFTEKIVRGEKEDILTEEM
jgi:hypothetical protein